MNEYQRYLLEEFADEYHERKMTRRDLTRRAVLIMGSASAAAAALAAVGCGGDDDGDDKSPAASTSVATSAAATTSAATTAAHTQPAGTTAAARTTAPAGKSEEVKFAGPGSDLLGYLARPASTAPAPGVLIIHENRGLTDHFRDVARRYAAEGFVALAIDLVSRAGGSKADTAQNTGALGRADPNDFIADLKAYAAYLQGLDGVRKGGIGVTGFCFGGGYSFEAAIAVKEAVAVVPYYGICRLIDQLATTQAAVLVIYGGDDARVTGQAERVKQELLKSGKPSEVKIYDGARHAFFNDTGGSYNRAAADDAWARTLAWFRTHLPGA